MASSDLSNPKTFMTPGNIILINGTSSSGKSSIIRAFQNLYSEPFLEAGIDKFIWMLPKRYLERPLWDDVLGLAVAAGSTGHRLVSGMHRAILSLALAGNNVIADHVLVETNWLGECTDLFNSLPAYLIGIYCPLPVLEKREKERPDRTLGQARAQFDRIHMPGIYDLEIDTSLSSPEDCANKIIERVNDPSPPVAFRKLKLFQGL